MSLLASLWLGGSLFGQTLSQPANLTQSTIHYTQGDFALPFQLKPGGRCPQQLDLLLSRDAGRSWQVQQSAAPAEGQFRLSRMDEGEYWLKVQARDAAGTAFSRTSMHLWVDKTKPDAQVQCDWSGEHDLLVSAKVRDAHLDLDTVVVQIRTDANQQLRPLPTQVAKAEADSVDVRGQIELEPCKSFEVRVTATDRAGNRCTLSERFFHPMLATKDDCLLPSLTEGNQEIDRPQASTDKLVDGNWMSIELGKPQVESKMQLVSVKSVQSQQSSRQTKKPEELVPPDRLELSPATIKTAGDIELQASGEPTVASTAKSVTPVESSSRRFRIRYDQTESIESLEKIVELWVTTDNGSTWEFWGTDRDAQSPAWVEVERAGNYGFCVVCIHSEADQRLRPSSGDAPDLLVKVKDQPVLQRLHPTGR